MESDKRKAILEAAEEIISQKGLADTTVSEIARRAGVVDSVMYQYFKGKEDLLFSIPEERLKEALNLLNEHLQGILDAESRLRKMVWFHLRYNDAHPGYAKILLLECRSSKDFYDTHAYQLIRQYTGILTDIIKQGVDDGVFHPDLDIRLVRNVVLGTIDMEQISCLAVREIEESMFDLEDIMSLTRAIITTRRESHTNKSERILAAAEKIIAEKGFAKSKISEIAKLAQVSEGTVYEYFENKEDLLLSIPEKHFGRYVNELSEIFHIKNPLRKLRRFIKYHYSLFLAERDFLKIFLLQILHNERFYSSKAYNSFQNYFRVVENIIEEGKAAGCFRPDVNARVFRNMFLGTFSHLALRWVIQGKEYQKDKITDIDQVADLLTAAVLPYQ